MVAYYLSNPKIGAIESLPSIAIATSLLENKQDKYVIGVIGNMMECRMPTLDKKYSGRFSEASIACRECSDMFYKSFEVSTAFRWMNIISRNIESGWVSVKHERVNDFDTIISPIGQFEDQRQCVAGVFETVVRNNTLVSPIRTAIKNGLRLRSPNLDINYDLTNNMMLYGPLSKMVEHGFVVKNNKLYLQYYQVHRLLSVARELMFKEQ
jgi:hypothetical protein